MEILIGTVNGEKENVSFYMDGDTLIAVTYNFRSTMSDSSIKELNGKYYAEMGLNFESELKHIEIPESVLNARDRIRKENELTSIFVSRLCSTKKSTIFYQNLMTNTVF